MPTDLGRRVFLAAYEGILVDASQTLDFYIHKVNAYFTPTIKQLFKLAVLPVTRNLFLIGMNHAHPHENGLRYNKPMGEMQLGYDCMFD